MISISGLTIKINKGNAAGFQLKLKGEELPQDGTIVRFRVRKNQNYKVPTIEKLIPIEDGFVNIDILPEDTENVNPGDYHWNLAILYDEGDEGTLVLDGCLCHRVEISVVG